MTTGLTLFPSLQPFLLGKAVVPFQQWLVAPSFSFQCQLDVRSSTLAKDVSEVDPAIGKLEVQSSMLWAQPSAGSVCPLKLWLKYFDGLDHSDSESI